MPSLALSLGAAARKARGAGSSSVNSLLDVRGCKQCACWRPSRSIAARLEISCAGHLVKWARCAELRVDCLRNEHCHSRTRRTVRIRGAARRSPVWSIVPAQSGPFYRRLDVRDARATRTAGLMEANGPTLVVRDEAIHELAPGACHAKGRGGFALAAAVPAHRRRGRSRKEVWALLHRSWRASRSPRAQRTTGTALRRSASGLSAISRNRNAAGATRRRRRSARTPDTSRGGGDHRRALDWFSALTDAGQHVTSAKSQVRSKNV